MYSVYADNQKLDIKFTINNSTKAMLVGLIPLGMLYGLVLFVKIRLGILF